MDAVGDRTVGRPRFCPECGARLGEEDLFCGGCGGAVASGVFADAPSAATLTPARASVVAPRRGLRYVPLVAALGAVGAATLALSHRNGVSSHPASTAPFTPSAPAPRYFDYTLNVDLSELHAPTQVRVEIEDPDGRRVVEDRRRGRDERIRATARAKGDAVTWRVFYDGALVKTVRADSSGRSS